MTAQQNTFNETEKTGKSDKLSSSFVTKSNKNAYFIKKYKNFSYQFYSIQNKYIEDQHSYPNLVHHFLYLYPEKRNVKYRSQNVQICSRILLIVCTNIT